MNKTALVLVIIGALNWGLISLFNFNYITALLGVFISKFVFVIVGLAALWCIKLLFQHDAEHVEHH